MKEINKREFTRNIYHYLQEGQYVITNNGEKEYVVTIDKFSHDKRRDTLSDLIENGDVTYCSDYVEVT